MTTDKLTCPECTRGTNWNSNAYDWETCTLCSGSGDLLQGEMTEARARAILAAAREKYGGIVSGKTSGGLFAPTYSDILNGWCATSYAGASEFVFGFEESVTSFLSSPRVTEALDFIFRK